MSAPEILFQAVNLAVLPFWFLMIVLPAWSVTRVIIGSIWPFVLLPALYAVLVVPKLPEVLPVLLNPKLANIALFLGTPEAAVVGWIHFLAFDLFVGRWIYLDSRRQGISAWVMAPVLFLTLLFGPCGLLVYLLAFGRRSEPASESEPALRASQSAGEASTPVAADADRRKS